MFSEQALGFHRAFQLSNRHQLRHHRNHIIERIGNEDEIMETKLMLT